MRLSAAMLCYSLAIKINIPQIHDTLQSMQKEQMGHYPLMSCLIVKSQRVCVAVAVAFPRGPASPRSIMMIPPPEPLALPLIYDTPPPTCRYVDPSCRGRPHQPRTQRRCWYA